VVRGKEGCQLPGSCPQVRGKAGWWPVGQILAALDGKHSQCCPALAEEIVSDREAWSMYPLGIRVAIVLFAAGLPYRCFNRMRLGCSLRECNVADWQSAGPARAWVHYVAQPLMDSQPTRSTNPLKGSIKSQGGTDPRNLHYTSKKPDFLLKI
jgi:hypothetical protein